MSLGKLRAKLENKINLSPHFGEITHIYSNTIKANGLRTSIGDIVSIKGTDSDILGIVSTIDVESFSIIPFTSTQGYKIGDKVFINQRGLKIGVGDGLLTCGKGQKMGIFAGSGVGKSSLLGMIVRGSNADVKVIALIGERGREVPEFIIKNLGNDLTNTVIVVATSDDSPLMRKYGAFSAMSIAEYFKNQNKDVLFIMDSVTRFAMAQREIGLSLGEPPTSKGYPPSSLSLLPQLMERAGKEENKGSITAFFTVLVEGDDLNDPITDQSRSILDGHIVLSRELGEFGIYPPINILSSASRIMNDIIDKKHKENAIKFRKAYALLKENEVLIRIGSYQKGSDKELDNALSKKDKLDTFLQQDSSEILDFNTIYTKLNEIFQ